MPIVKTKPRFLSKIIKGRAAAKLPTGKIIFQSPDRQTNNTKKKLVTSIEADKIKKSTSEFTDKEKISSMELNIGLSWNSKNE